MDKIHLAQDNEHWRAAGNRKIEPSDSIKLELLAQELLASQEMLCFMGLVI
jgi:hypothetical protein